MLHERLAADTIRLVGSLPLCELLLMNDARFPWLILVPRVAGAARHHRPADDNRIAQLNDESVQVQRALRALFSPDKLNVAAIGNLVPQLHVHHVARFSTDSEWPAPVWGRGKTQPYDATLLDARLAALRGHTAAWNNAERALPAPASVTTVQCARDALKADGRHSLQADVRA
jgi:diadenosine tetraphosphate (Ap4A) HIT family hydrolase